MNYLYGTFFFFFLELTIYFPFMKFGQHYLLWFMQEIKRIHCWNDMRLSKWKHEVVHFLVNYYFKRTTHKHCQRKHYVQSLLCSHGRQASNTQRIRSAVQCGIVIIPSVCVSLRTQNTDLRTHAVAPPLQDPTDPEEEGEKERERWIEPQPCQDGLKESLWGFFQKCWNWASCSPQFFHSWLSLLSFILSQAVH